MNAPSVPAAGVPAFFATRMALVFSAPMMVMGIAFPFFPLWLEMLSISEFQIGIVLAVPMFVRVFTVPAAGALADRLNDRTTVLLWSGLLALSTSLALFFTGTFWPILILYTLQGIAFAPYMPIADAITLSGVRRWNVDYGRIRLWGSLAFIVATMAGGWLSQIYGGAMVLPALAACYVLTVLAAVIAPRIGRPRRPSPVAAMAVPAGGALRQRDVQLMLFGVSLVAAGHSMYYAFSAIHWQKRGFDGTEIGLLWSAGVLAEVLLFVFAARLRKRFSLWSMLIFGSAVSVGRWLLFPADWGFAGYFALQCLHAFTFAVLHICVLARIVERVPEAQEGAAQGVYFLYNGLFVATGTFISGHLFTRYGGDAFYLMAIPALAGLACIIAGRLVAPPERGADAVAAAS